MKLRHAPYVQIARVLLRSVNPQDARWLYVIVAFCMVLTVVGGFTGQWALAALIRTVFGTIIFTLQFVGVYAFITLMRLNHPVVSRLVPGYVPALRRSALAVWLCICAITGLVAWGGGSSAGESLTLSFVAGAVMLLISTPLRWPVRWFLFLVGLVWFLNNAVPYLFSLPANSPVVSRIALTTYAAAMFSVMGWLVTRLMAERGSAYASMFSRFLGMQQSERVLEKSDSLDVRKFSLWFKIYTHAAQMAKLPWQRYTSYLLARPQPGAANTLSRAELGFGPVVHWVSQVSLCAIFILALVLVWWNKTALLPEDGSGMPPNAVFYLALVNITCAVTSVLYFSDVMLRTQGEQKLMLMLPGLPQGIALNQMLAQRHLRQAFAAWALANAWVVVLPYPDSVVNYVAAVCWGTLPLVPFVLQDWAHARAPQAGQSMLTLALQLLGPVSAWVALRWLHLPVELLAAASVGLCLLVLHVRWRRVAHYAQALPVGRLA